MSSYKDSLNMPVYTLPMKAELPKVEPQMLADWRKNADYDTLRQTRAGKPVYTVHCGPPYANGRLHGGHLVPSILKDIVVRSKSMQGFDTPYIPGWDCHGLPIESKVEKNLIADGKTRDDLTVSEFRDQCRDYAKGWIDAQKADWQRMGCIADWDKPYITMAASNEANIARVLGQVAQSGLLYKAYRPVMWSTVEKTTLAEAEIEYADKTSRAIHVAFPVKGKEDEFVVAWTTTPWSLPGNQALSVGENIEYAAVKVQANDGKAAKVGATYWVSANCVEDFAAKTGVAQYEITEQKKGADMAGLTCVHPLFGRDSRIFISAHTTDSEGTGIVHIAPAHGVDDFAVGKKNNLDLVSPVDEGGNYIATTPVLARTQLPLAGRSMEEAEPLILDELKDAGLLLAEKKHVHSYPVSWRSKAPLICRTASQWFIAMDKPYTEDGKTLRERALEEVRNVGWVPEEGQNRITAMLQDRPDWCISRQRTWGVPVAIFRNDATGEFITDPEVFASVTDKIEKHGIDAWETLPVTELLPQGWAEKNNVDPARLTREKDILDVWFDSGSSYAHVLKARGLSGQADLYMEGSDQHRGWFQSSLLLSLVTDNRAPFKEVATHGFVVDGEGKKMSKSLGNGVDAIELMDKYGADVVRLWIASTDYRTDLKFSPDIISGVSDSYRKVRNTVRHALGNLTDFDEARDAVPYDKLPEMDRWALARYASMADQVQSSYDSMSFHNATKALIQFCTRDMSNQYFDFSKDTLYCDAADSHERRSTQTVLNHIAKGLITRMAPVMPFTADQSWRLIAGADKPVYLEEFTPVQAEWRNPELLARWDDVLKVRDVVNMHIERDGRATGAFTKSTQADVEIQAPTDMFAVLSSNAALREVLQAASVKVVPASELNVEVHAANTDECGRCRISRPTFQDLLCSRCFNVVSEYESKPAAYLGDRVRPAAVDKGNKLA